MSVGSKYSNVQIFRLMLYGRALHPELFDLQHRYLTRHGEYEVEAWLVPAGHVVRFQVAGQCLTETVLESGDHLPDSALVHALPCMGQKDYEMKPQPGGRIGYVTTIQTETLAENLYTSTMRELEDTAREPTAVTHRWTDGEGVPCMSILDAQKYRKEYHVQSYHLLGGSGTILRTQSIFEIK